MTAIVKMTMMNQIGKKSRQSSTFSFRLPGPREYQILEIVWEWSPVSVAGVIEQLGAASPLAYTTVMTICDQLYRKGLLERRRRGKAYIYTPAVARQRVEAALVSQFLVDFFHHDPARLRPHLESPASATGRRRAAPAPATPPVAAEPVEPESDPDRTGFGELEDFLL